MFVAKFYATARYNIMFKTIRPWGVSAAHMTLLLFENTFPLTNPNNNNNNNDDV